MTQKGSCVNLCLAHRPSILAACKLSICDIADIGKESEKLFCGAATRSMRECETTCRLELSEDTHTFAYACTHTHVCMHTAAAKAHSRARRWRFWD